MSNYLPLIVRKILLETGWNENELAVYSALLEKGAMSLTDLSHETSIPISTLQYVLKKLSLKKMISKTMMNEKPLYTVSNVDQLKKWMKGYLKKFEQFQDTIDKFIDQYDFNPELYTPKIRFYEGTKGVKQSYRQMLRECPDKEIFATFAVIEEIEPELQKFFVEEYVPARVKRKIKIKNIALRSPKSLVYQKNDAKNLSTTKLVSKEYFPLLNTEINLYGNFMHCMSFNEKGAFAMILKDKDMVLLLRGLFSMAWTSADRLDLHMTDSILELEPTIESRRNLYPPDLKDKWKTATPNIIKSADKKETILEIMGHEVMSSYQLPYMKKLADIVTQNGGDILNVGYGLGILDDEIEKLRKKHKLNEHYVIEFNEGIAKQARKNKNLIVIEDDWHEAIMKFRGKQFDGIVYDGYPLDISEAHRDGIIFIEKVVERNLLKEDGILTFYIDARDKLGEQFKSYLKSLGFNHLKIVKVPIKAPERKRQIWRADHFLAPILKYN